ncbi:CHASE2 domain-containing protein [Iningainema tapete]|uniref:Adenylate/guanylate cyclase domain-containing protein n=1 Tax=Iningainema tapete BLCC-T55 TaxID=2748662 RepID=A0A8J7BX80_9CYAN|nr:adenylate/guanylate cyclase domain-containing protein [Iningainema tapete]MBD2772428.1 adenylate/guanylate cyclase domain-containing protein [Iningainema tapete BLCC-T55]
MWANIRKQIWQLRAVLIVTSSVASVLIGLRAYGLLQPLEWAALDEFFRLRPFEPVDTRIVIVEVTESDIRKNKWPISDEKLAQLLKILKQQQPRALALDIYRDLPVEPGHQELEKVFKTTPNLIGIQKVIGDTSGFAVNPPKTLSNLGQVSANDLVIDVDGKIRRSLLSTKDKNNQVVLSLGAQLGLIYLEAEGITLQAIPPVQSQRRRLGKATLVPFQANDGGYVKADAGGYQILANFRNLRQGFRKISITNVLEGRMPKDLVRDRIVLIGVTAESSSDFFYTPYSSGLLGQSPKAFTGVEIHADVASQLLSAALEGRPQIKVWSEPLEWLWIFGCAFVGAILSWTQHWKIAINKVVKGVALGLPLTSTIIMLVGGAVICGSYAAFLSGWWIPVVPAVLALFLSAVTITAHIARTTNLMRQAFGRYLTNEVVANLLETPGGLKFGGERRKVTLLISTLGGFSAISERLSPEKAVEVGNLYLEEMIDVITQYQGTINDFMGDRIFAIFGTPIQREDDAVRAVACALAMQLKMNSINIKLSNMNLSPLEMGIGLHTGEVLAGNIGSQRRAKYTVMGSNVNLAHQIESYTVGGQVLVSKDTFKDAGPILRVDGQMQVKLKEIRETITVYDIGGVGGKFNLCLPKHEEILVTLVQEIPLQFMILENKLEDKNLPGEVFQGSLVKLSTTSAEFRSHHPLQLFSNLLINLLPGGEQASGLGDIYAKVMAVSAHQQINVGIRFTAVPPEAVAFLAYIRQSGS